MTGDCHVRFCERLRGETPLCLLGKTQICPKLTAQHQLIIYLCNRFLEVPYSFSVTKITASNLNLKF